MKKEELPQVTGAKFHKNLEFKEFKVGVTEENGVKTATFEGIGNMLNEVDLGGDIIHSGAFQKTIQENGGRVYFLLDHKYDTSSYAGIAYVEEVGNELKARVELLLEDNGVINEAGQSFHIKAKHAQSHGKRFGMSIGYSIPKGKYDYKDGIRNVYEVKLHELTGTMFPMSDPSRISNIKSDLSKLSEQELKTSLKVIQSLLKNSLQIEEPSEDTQQEEAELNQLLNEIKNTNERYKNNS